MAARIGPTPILRGNDAEEWRQKVEEEKDVKLGPVPTPDLEKLRQTILADAKKREK